ncbi:hypothetical protein GCM10010151_44180 [Actinoallomurus spadix]|uniref:Uncharacterized protein n=2 Tax=Actinoallomurus spadix TaxID=79912 RepID=A0ABP3GPB1_9ACTN
MPSACMRHDEFSRALRLPTEAEYYIGVGPHPQGCPGRVDLDDPLVEEITERLFDRAEAVA